ncbi:NAD(P)H-binding protein [Streptomyces lunaelactis]|uniref:SDR family oxidoreductase n=1 Tax=Streptomyces lunaelactis TaxID=1535768 RepID=UPI001584511D|nr:NAD(P)H-binding protein [Streptomyces lunaelactis]NUK06693.1 NAD(P)H-binding protein [Streptomyces lunaelactis]NUK23859.1 NAD(P)H-binding protein [Streptomyces lunaelactis]NUK33118.1 NAD(P)H-binding protein [Streptomyces lunaelactis]NUK43567.1 NAD(P)H-binding protein [Streptomyces lunaelactis]NUK51334.1 NAD(P)H-binding protein [Streptomyces lunaelactis]
MTSILVTGGTGTLGSRVSAKLREGGHEVRVLSRHSQAYAVDLRNGTGLDAAVEGVDAIVHCASAPRGGDDEAASRLLDAARRAEVPHLLYISIVGVDRLPLGYYVMKRKVERMIEEAGESGPGWTILRTTQFHDLVLRMLAGAARLPVMPLPSGVSVQPIHTDEVAERLAELAVTGPAGRVEDMGGPEIRPLPDLARAYLRARGRRRPLLPVRLAGKAYAGYRAGDHLTPERAVGKVTFEQFLTQRLG